MKKALLPICVFFLSYTLSNAQENNPLINSGLEIETASKLYDDRKYKEAIEKLSTVSESDTNYVLARYELALSCSADSQYARAIGYCEEAIGLTTQRNFLPQLYALQGTLYSNSGKADRALSVYDSAISMYPAYIQLYIGKGATLFQLKKYKEAGAVFKQGLMINPYYSLLHYNLGVTALKEGNPVAAFLSLTTYLLMDPEGAYAKNTLTLLNNISLAKDEITADVNARKGDISESFRVAEDILLSRIALEKNYKPIIKIDDVISRQMQVILEKLEFDKADTDFWMQYYVPWFHQAFASKKFELLVNYAFSGVNIEDIKKFNKNNKKELQHFVEELVTYFNLIRRTRELNAGKREQIANSGYYFSDNILTSKGELNGDHPAGPWEFYFSSGNLKSKGSFNKKGDRTGTWKFYYFDGTLKGEENYLDGKEEGEELYYFSNRMISVRSFYQNGNLEGKKSTYYRNGNISSVQEYKNGKLNGRYDEYYGSGVLKSTVMYTDDKYEGGFLTYFENGNIEKKGSYSQGLLSGPYKTYYSTGALSQESSYEKDNINGTLKAYYQNGKLQKTEIYKNGRQDGEYAQFHNNGQLNFRCNYKNGVYTGDIDYHDTDGIKYSTRTFVSDNLVSGKYFDKKGQEISSSAILKGKLNYAAYGADGYKISITPYDEKNEVNGLRQFFYKSGKLSETDEYKNNELNGKVLGYGVNGKLSFSHVYKDGKKDGYCINYFQNGSKDREGWYVNDQAQGTFIYYDERGNMINQANFLDDEFNGVQREYWPNSKLKFKNVYELGSLVSITQFDTLGHQIGTMKLINGNGKYLTTYPNGKPAAEGAYKNGHLDGVFKTFYFDGRTESVKYFKGGLLDSTYVFYNYDGKLVSEGHYIMNEKSGIWKSYSKIGKLYSQQQYVHGQLQGKYTYFFENGKTDTEINYVDGERDGESRKYDIDGALLYQLKYKEGEITGYSYLNSKAELIPEVLILGGSGVVKTFYANGKPSADFVYADGELNGVDNLYYSNGKPNMLSTEIYGSSEGVLQQYYANGNRKTEYNYQYDNAHGPYKEFSESGAIKETGSYYNGSLHGNVARFDEKGKLLETRHYYYGQLLGVTK